MKIRVRLCLNFLSREGRLHSETYYLFACRWCGEEVLRVIQIGMGYKGFSGNPVVLEVAQIRHMR